MIYHSLNLKLFPAQTETVTTSSWTPVPATSTSVVAVGAGEFMSQDDFNHLTPAQQTTIMQIGVTAYNAQAQALNAEIQAKYTKLDDGSYVSTDYFNKLSPQDRQELKTGGVNAFNASKEKENVAANAANEQIFRATHYQLNNGEWVNSASFLALSPDLRAKLANEGVNEFNKDMAKAKADYDTFVSNNTQLADGEWVSNDFYNSLSFNDRQLLNDEGIDSFNQNHPNLFGII